MPGCDQHHEACILNNGELVINLICLLETTSCMFYFESDIENNKLLLVYIHSAAFFISGKSGQIECIKVHQQLPAS